MATKPTVFPEWATSTDVDPTSGQLNRVEPSAGVKDTGFVFQEIPPRQYMNYQLWLINQWLEHFSGTLDQFAPHEAAVPDMTVVIDAGRVFDGVTHTAKAQQITTTITAPVTNPRIDRVAIDNTTGNYVIITGAEAASPVAPNYGANHFPVCQIALATSTTQIANVLITDERGMVISQTKPSFSVHRNGTAQTNITGIDKVEWTNEEFDTNSNFDSTTNYRFTPTVAGKYLFSATARFTSVTAGDPIILHLYKNGTSYKTGGTPAQGAGELVTVTSVVDMNGSTDYVEVFAENQARDTSGIDGSTNESYFTGCKID